MSNPHLSTLGIPNRATGRDKLDGAHNFLDHVTRPDLQIHSETRRSLLLENKTFPAPCLRGSFFFC
jgi:hypothetical protein